MVLKMSPIGYRSNDTFLSPSIDTYMLIKVNDIDRCLLINLIGLQGYRSIPIVQRNRFAKVSTVIYRTRQMLRISYFWPDWNSYVRLGVFHNIFGTKGSRSILFPKICLKFLIIGFLASVAYSVAQ